MLCIAIIGLSVASLTPGVAVAEPSGMPLAEDATLADYIAYAEANSPTVSAAYHRWQADLDRAPQVGSLPDPKFGFAEQFESVETRVGAQQRKFSLSQTLPWFGKLGLRKSVALERANASEQRYIAQKLHLEAQVTNLYFELYYLNQSISIVQDNLTLVNEWENVAETKYRSAILSQGKLAQIQIEQARLSDDLQTQKERFSEVVVAFNSALDRETSAGVSLLTEPGASLVSMSDDEIVALALERSPALHERDKLILASVAGIKLANRGPAPNLTFGVDYVQTNDAIISGVFESGKDPVIAKIGLSLPLWYGKYKAEKREAKSRNLSALESRKATENMLRTALSTQLFKLHDASRKIDLYRNAMIPRATQALVVTQREFGTGKTDFRNYIDLQRELFGYLLSLQRALTNYRQSLANVEALTGAKITQ
jgi:outer membrane protein, heavy metal efflux system